MPEGMYVVGRRCFSLCFSVALLSFALWCRHTRTAVPVQAHGPCVGTGMAQPARGGLWSTAHVLPGPTASQTEGS